VIVLDTSVLVYALGAEHPLREPARRVLTAVEDGRAAATTTPEVLQEFTHVYARRRSRGAAVGHARRWASALSPLLTATEADVEPALNLYEQDEQLGSFDALLAAVALREDARALVSADRAFAAVPRLSFVELGSSELDALLA